MPWKLLAIGAGLVLGLPLAVTAGCGRAFVFHPTGTTDAQRTALAAGGWTLDAVEVAPGVVLQGLARPPTSTDAPWVLAFGGNAMDLGTVQWVCDDVRGSLDIGFAAYAYRGYDGSGGAPSERALTHDAALLPAHLATRFGVTPERLSVLGISLGTGVAAQLAAHLGRAGTPARQVVLVSPFTSVAAIFDENVPLVPVGWAVRDGFRTDRVLDDIRGPVLIVHGTDDPLIPIAHGRALAGALGDRATLVELAGRGHNDVFDGPEARDAIRGFLAPRGVVGPVEGEDVDEGGGAGVVDGGGGGGGGKGGGGGG